MKLDIKQIFLSERRNIFFLIVLWTVPCVLSGVLFFEYRYFRKHVHELELLREEYNNCLLAIKKNFDMATDDEDASIVPARGAKVVSSNDDNEDEFVVVNRSEQYLRDSAALFAEKQKKSGGFVDAVKRLYDSSRMVERRPERTGRRRRMRAHVVRRRHPALSRAVLYKDDDVQGGVVREALFDLPIPRGKWWISSPFGPRRLRGKWIFHHGIDMAAVKGTPVRAAAAGQVVEAGFDRGYGKTVMIAHDKKFTTRYAHLDRILVKAGHEVAAGQTIGCVGATGFVLGRNGVHLHFEVGIYGRKVNPFYYLK